MLVGRRSAVQALLRDRPAVSSITLWACKGYRCVLVVDENEAWDGELQLLDQNEVLLQQRLTAMAEAAPLARAWERQYEPLLLVCGRYQPSMFSPFARNCFTPRRYSAPAMVTSPLFR